jgi:hypothetical protein
MTRDADAVRLFLQADRTYQDSLQETVTLERVRAEALLQAKSTMTVAHLAAAGGMHVAELRRQLARARRLTEPSDTEI